MDHCVWNKHLFTCLLILLECTLKQDSIKKSLHRIWPCFSVSEVGQVSKQVSKPVKQSVQQVISNKESKKSLYLHIVLDIIRCPLSIKQYLTKYIQIFTLEI